MSTQKKFKQTFDESLTLYDVSCNTRRLWSRNRFLNIVSAMTHKQTMMPNRESSSMMYQIGRFRELWTVSGRV